MPEESDIKQWMQTIRHRYQNYLQTSFYFKDPALRQAFASVLQGDELTKGPYPEQSRNFKMGVEARKLATQCFPGKSEDLLPALLEGSLYSHQDRAVRATYLEHRNIIVATGTASGKTECFLYPILFDLYRQHLDGRLQETRGAGDDSVPYECTRQRPTRASGENCRTTEQFKVSTYIRPVHTPDTKGQARQPTKSQYA